ncbi:shikimate kinase [Lachnospiraceae bacterium 62-35]
MKENIILIGFMGAGKTSVGQQLARQQNCSFLDIDEYIEKRAGMAVSQIFEIQGEEAFRRMETESLRELAGNCRGCVISVGGGLPVREENRKLLKQLGTVIYLRVMPKTVEERLKGDKTRPMLQGGDSGERIRTLLAFRNPLYEEAADHILDADGKTVKKILEEIRAL